MWLSEVGEARASAWSNDTWTGERGNYTNATAGFVGNNLSSGIEFTPSLLQCLSIRGKQHADKILCPKTGVHIFPSEATYIPSKLWGKFRISTFIVSFCRTVKHRSTSIKYGQRTWNYFTVVAKESRLVRLSPGLELLA